KGVSGAANNIAVTEAGIEEVNVLLANAETDYMRYEALYERQAVTKQQYDAVRTQYESLKAKVETMKRQRKGTGIVRDERSIRLAQQDAAIDVARAALNLARLNLGYCTVLAPCDGSTSRRLVQQGELVQPGMRLFSIVDEEDRRIVANYRETQLKGIRTGAPVKITVDAMKGQTFNGVVANISTATGAQYSPVAPDNATGNFVKVEQRVPVKITFTGDNDEDLLRRLTAGMNAECTVMK
ncbi:MAG: efflux RND transporter periplasmic adaptor subunit, partial [Prevotella sp.]|nr:efflux RND transporter periplasmic adaptor subunit [Prevotella sp.]